MTLVDTSVWVEHLRRGNTQLQDLLEDGYILCHPFVAGELACGNLRNRVEILSLLTELPHATVARHDEVTSTRDQTRARRPPPATGVVLQEAVDSIERPARSTFAAGQDEVRWRSAHDDAIGAKPIEGDARRERCRGARSDAHAGLVGSRVGSDDGKLSTGRLLQEQRQFIRGPALGRRCVGRHGDDGFRGATPRDNELRSLLRRRLPVHVLGPMLRR